VIALEGDSALLQTQNKLTCASCHVSDSCGNGIIERYFSGKMFETRVKNTLEAKIGDRLVIEMMKSNLTKASVIVYLLPIVLMLISALFGNLLNLSENVLILTSLIGLTLGLVLAGLFNQSVKGNSHYQPQMKSIINRQSSQSLQTKISVKTSN